MLRPIVLAFLCALAFAGAVVPTLKWLEFSSGGENLLVATVLEMRLPVEDGRAARGWLVPSLNDQPRLRKPPLPAWVTAALLPQACVDEIRAAPLGLDRDTAYQRLAYALRVPAVLLACLIVLLTYDIGRTLDRPALGIAAAAAVAGSLLMLRYGRSVSSDVHLAFWVTAANAALVRALCGRPAWTWLPLAGAAVGLAILSKGPVALIQTVLPAIVAAGWLRGVRGESVIDKPAPTRPWAWPAAAGLGVCVIVAVPWFAYVLWTAPGDVAGVWWSEVTRRGATGLANDPWYAYGSILALAAPWSILFVAGLAVCLTRSMRRTPAGAWTLAAIVVPVVVMSLVKDKNERYLLPLAAPVGLAVAQAILPLLRPWAALNAVERLLAGGHWALLAALCVGVPVAGSAPAWLPGGQAWWDVGRAVGIAAFLASAWGVAVLAARRRPVVFVPATMLLMFAVHAVFLYGYRNSPAGASEMKPIADAVVSERPSAEVWYFDPRPQPKPLPQDLQIYTGRVVRVASAVEALPAAGAGDRVVVMLRREGEPPPALPGYVEIARRAWGKRSWHALAPATDEGQR